VPRLDTILAPATTAVLVVDVQNDFCSPDGATAKSGRSVQASIDMVPRLDAFLGEARKRGVYVAFICVNNTAYTTSEAWAYRASETPRQGNCREGTWGAELYGVTNQPGEPIVVKHRNSGFHQTRLDLILRTWKIETCIVTGTATNVSVEATARDVVQHDYNLVLLDDCTAAYEQHAHDATLYNIRTFYGAVTSSAAVVEIWKQHHG
jgi:ureidoacrylate peracid hydrolase